MLDNSKSKGVKYIYPKCSKDWRKKPEISRFYGIVIVMYSDDHEPPHIHAFYNEYEILINIKNLVIIRGYMPPKAIGMIMEWIEIHQEELLQNWKLAFNCKHTFKIEPLK